jgi:hypothetical protein
MSPENGMQGRMFSSGQQVILLSEARGMPGNYRGVYSDSRRAADEEW